MSMEAEYKVRYGGRRYVLPCRDLSLFPAREGDVAVGFAHQGKKKET